MDANVLNLLPDAVPRDGTMMMGPVPELTSMSMDRSSLEAFLKSFGMNENADVQELPVLSSDEMLQMFADNPGP